MPPNQGAAGLGTLLWVLDCIAREALLFAAVGFLVGGIDDLAVDLIFLARAIWSRAMRRHAPIRSTDDLPVAATHGFAVFIPAWDESRVIGAMLSTALARFDYPDYRIYVGCYPNDRATVDIVAAVAERDARVRLVIGATPGPTTKADCLNVLWGALLRDDAREGRCTKAVVLHDAEDVVHAAELRVFDTLIAQHAVIQLPVLPLVQRRSRWVAGHYSDEFAEAHAKSMVVRELIGAALPLAGTGCAIATDTLRAIAGERGGTPFDASSLTEDYELGLTIGARDMTATFVRVVEAPGRAPVAVRAYFPATLNAAVVQKARWMIGIALAGWDRTGWGRWSAFGDHWMRMRDRRALMSVLVLATAYGALVLWASGWAAHALSGTQPAPLGGWTQVLLGTNGVLLAWRLAMRAAFTGQAYGWREALLAPVRAVVGNLIAILAARRALVRYLGLLQGQSLRWDKTEHVFPDLIAVDGE